MYTVHQAIISPDCGQTFWIVGSHLWDLAKKRIMKRGSFTVMYTIQIKPC